MSEYPSDWKVMALGEVAEVVGGGTPSRDTPAFWGDDHYWITPSEVVAIDGKMASHSKEKISNLGLASSGAKLHPPGTILMTSRASIGFAAIAVEDICTNQGFQSLRCGKALDNWFALHQIRHRRAELQQLAAGSTFLEVSGSNIRSFPFVIPPLPVQKKIAEILSGIDRQITLGRHSLEKLALLERATIKSAIDRIENIHSDCRQLTAGEICRKIFVGIASSTTHAYTDKTGVPMLRNQNIKLGTIDSADLVYINKDFAEEQKSKRLLKGDVITARTGYPGASAVVGREFEDCHSFTTLISRVETSIVIPEYYSLYLNSPQGKAQVAQLQAGGAQENLNVGALEKMIIPIPDLKTQISIVKASEELLKTYRAKESVVRKCERMKEALSADLLSGRKRVSV